MTTEYHLEELEIIRNKTDPRRIVPTYQCSGWKVLDVGCGMGQTLTAPEFDGAELHGVDPDLAAVQAGVAAGLNLCHAPAEHLPYPNATFDLVFSRVALLYTDIPKALSEMRRVLKPGGILWLTVNPVSFEYQNIVRALVRFDAKRLIDRAYVVANSALFALSGRCVKRPWANTFECVQTNGGMRRALKRAGFHSIVIQRGHHFLVTALA